MKKLIALFAVTTLATTTAIAGIDLTGTASVSYDDNGSSASATTYDADLTVTATNGGTTLTAAYDMEGANLATTAVDLATTIGPVTIAADMFNAAETNLDDGDGDYRIAQDDTSVTISLDVPVGDATIGIDNSGNISVSGTFSGVTVTHTQKAGPDKTVLAASIAGMDIDVTNDAGASTWSIGTTVSGVALTIDSENDVTAEFGLTGNTLTVTHNGTRAAVAATANTGTVGYYVSTAVYSLDAVAAYTTVAISRDLTSGATLAATWSSLDDSLTLKASVTF